MAMTKPKNYIVYKHTSPNGKVYIGITGCKPSKRWSSGRGYHQNKHFASAINKYGWENITHEVLMAGLSASEAKQNEVLLIKKHKSANRLYGYNQTLGGDLELRTDESKMLLSAIKRKQMENPEIRSRVLASQKYRDKSYCKTESYRKMRSECMKAQWEKPEFRQRVTETHTGVFKVTKKDVAVVCLETGKQYQTIAQASKDTGASRSNIRTCCYKKTYTTQGLHWRLASDTDRDIPCNDRFANLRKAVLCEDTGVRYESIKQAAESQGVSTTAISNCLKGKTFTSNGKRWIYG